MRKVTREAAQAFLEGRAFSQGNTQVKVAGPTIQLLLHSNIIAERLLVNPESFFHITDANWQTTTTKERLNGLLELSGSGMKIYQKDFTWYLSTSRSDDLEIEAGEWLAIDGRSLATCAA